jgi:5-hmdU DNA kinase-like protein
MRPRTDIDRSAPYSFARKRRPKPTVVYDSYWTFAHERLAIYHRRLAGAAPPWTQDAILRQYRFTNVYRASDRVSQYLIRSVIYSGEQSPREVLFRTLLFKLFNKVETWELLVRHFGTPSAAEFDLREYGRVLSRAMAARKVIYSAAYIIPSPPFGAVRKHDNHLRLLRRMLDDSTPRRIAECSSLRGVFESLASYPSIGPFLAYQFAIDLNYGPHVNHHEMDFVVPGPGARDGIRKCFSDLGDYTEEDMIRLVADSQEGEFAARGMQFPGLWGRPLQLIDCQNLFCEIDKYARVAHPAIAGISGRTRIKQSFTAAGALDAPWFPPKWNVHAPPFPRITPAPGTLFS